MKYNNLHIRTQREAPNNARTEGFSFLVRAGYVTRENILTQLGEYTINHLRALSSDSSFILHPFESLRAMLSLRAISNDDETYFPIKSGAVEVIHCPSCKYTDRLELAHFTKTPALQEEQLPTEKVLTPDCNTIESLANFLGIPKEKTAKALMYTRTSDNKFVFVVVRGDMQMSEAKLKKLIEDVRPATYEEISNSGASAGFASPIGLKDALIVVDELIPQSQNLAAGANETGYHLKNTNYGRDYTAEIVADLVQAQAGDSCPNCGQPLAVISCNILASHKEFHFENILLALAETYHDEKGLTLPKSAAPFDVYLMHLPGKEMDTRAKAEEIYVNLQSAGVSVLFDDRDERAGVKFNDADLVGCPVRVTVGERGLQNGMVELKKRTTSEIQHVELNDLVSIIRICVL
jgi:prolyl-tRNA synthetase